MTVQLVQHAQHAITTAATTCTVTLGAGTTAGNTLIVAVAYYTSGGSITVTGVTLGGSAGNFVQRATETPSGGPYLAVWENYSIPGGQTSVVVTLSVSGYAAVDVYEVSGLIPTGAWIRSAGDSGSGTAWTSGTGYPQPGNTFTVAIGAGPVTVAGPSTTVDLIPWTSSAVQTWNASSASGEVSGYMIAYQPETATRLFTYSGTCGSGDWAGLVASFEAPFVPVLTLPALTAGVTPSQGYMTSQLVQPLSFGQQKMVFRAICATTTQTIASSGFTLLSFDTILEDPWMGSTNSPESVWANTYSGFFQICLSVYTQTPPNANITLQIWITSDVGSTQVGAAALPASAGGCVQGSIWYEMSQIDDVVGVYASLQNASGDVTTSITPGQQSSIEILYLGAIG